MQRYWKGLYTDPSQVLQGTLVWVSRCMIWSRCCQGQPVPGKALADLCGMEDP